MTIATTITGETIAIIHTTFTLILIRGFIGVRNQSVVKLIMFHVFPCDKGGKEKRNRKSGPYLRRKQ